MSSIVGIEKDRLAKRLLTWTLVYSIVMVWLVGWAVARIAGGGLGLPSQWLPLLFQTAIAACPLAILTWAVKTSQGGSRSLQGYRFAAGLVSTVSLLLWWAYYWDSLRVALGDGSGVPNITLGLMLVFSPAWLSLLIPLGYWLGTRERG